MLKNFTGKLVGRMMSQTMELKLPMDTIETAFAILRRLLKPGDFDTLMGKIHRSMMTSDFVASEASEIFYF